MEWHRTVGLGVVALALSGCEPELVYDYVPVTYATAEGNAAEPASSEVTPKPGGDSAAADFPIPKDNPRGDLRVASYGLVDIGPQTQQEQRIAAVHVRMTLTNNGDRPWTIDTREQRIALEGYGTSVAAFASADPGTAPPSVIVPSKGKRTVDLFFPLPKELQKQDNLPSFDTLWRVHADDQVVEGEAPFENIAVVPPAAVAPYDYGPDYYWGPPYWYNPYWADFGFYGAVVLSPFYFGYPLWVHHHDHYGHFHHGWYGHGYYGPHGGYYGPHGGYYGPHGGYYGPHGAYPHNVHPRGTYPYGGYRGSSPYGGYRGTPYGGYRRAYPHGATPYRGYPSGGYRGAPPTPYQNRPSYHPPAGGPRGVPGGGYRGGGHPGGGGHGGGGHR